MCVFLCALSISFSLILLLGKFLAKNSINYKVSYSVDFYFINFSFKNPLVLKYLYYSCVFSEEKEEESESFEPI